ncbi:MAG: sirohydrochlorin chelatase [Streptosporangiaceae bacterium]|nr:sirohydrochlorin chelatase [Streptosporangiaceae bacterium]MBV9855725.1 sirohydrochlorin chelatase [Streptosporangiaceae bacterium]
MRHPRLIAGTPPLVAVAHGSADPRAAGCVGDLLGLVRERAAARGLTDLDVRTAFLGHAPPSPGQVLGAIVTGPVVVLPLLLTAAYHSKTDIPALLGEARRAHPRLRISYGGTLGPHPLLLRALSRRLGDAIRDAGCAPAAGPGAGPGGMSVVLAAAGSSDPAANATIARLAARWQAAEGWRAVIPAYASAASPTPAEAVRALAPSGPVAVATYLLAPGFFADRVRREALDAGAAAVSDALGAAPEVADVVLDRYLAAAAQAEQVQRAAI